MIRGLLTCCLVLLAAPGCGGADTSTPKTGNDAKEATRAPDNTPQPAQADRSRCDSNGKRVVEMDVNKDGKADVWRFYGQQLDQGVRLDVLTCKESDLNYDGHKDMYVYYDATGNRTMEEFDLDFDGRIDMVAYYQQGKLVREELDTNFDGKTDIWKFYENDKLARLERSSNKNGHIDVWEYYEGGKLDRIGYDTTGSGKVDCWDRAPEDATPDSSASVPQPASTPTPPKSAPPAPPPAEKK